MHGQNDQLRLLRPAEQRALLDRFAGEAVAEPLEPLPGGAGGVAAGRAPSSSSAATAPAGSPRRPTCCATGSPRSPRSTRSRARTSSSSPRPGGSRRPTTCARSRRRRRPRSSAPRTSPDVPAALALIGEARHRLAAAGDAELAALDARLAEALALLGDVGAELAGYLDRLDADPERLAAVLSRQAELKALTRKYAADVDGVLAWADAARERLAGLDVSDEALAALAAPPRRAGRRAGRARGRRHRGPHQGRRPAGRRHHRRAGRARDGRRPAARRGHAARGRGRAPPTRCARRPSRAGGRAPTASTRWSCGSSRTPAPAPQPLHKGASGGELSRVMLALEVALAGADPVPTMVFDEVDAGVGGRAAVEIGRRLARLAARHQVIVVTHLPQVAAYADRHLVVDKSGRDGGKAPQPRAHAGRGRADRRAGPDAGRAGRHRHRPRARRGAARRRPRPPRRRPRPPQPAPATRPADASRAARHRRSASRHASPRPARRGSNPEHPRPVATGTSPTAVRTRAVGTGPPCAGLGVPASACFAASTAPDVTVLRMKLSGLLQPHPARAARAVRHRPRRPAHRRALSGASRRARSPCSTRSTSTGPPPTRSSPPGSSAVVNASPSISGRFPNLGPEILIDAGIALVDDVGARGPAHDQGRQPDPAARRRRLRRGARSSAEGVAQDADSVADALVEAKSGLTHQLEAFAANTIEFMRRERALLLDGVGVPDVDVELAGPAGARRRRRVRPRRRARPAQGLHPRVPAGAGRRGRGRRRAARGRATPPTSIVGDPSEVSNEALTCGADVVVPGVHRRARPRPAPRAGPRGGRGHVPQHRPTPRTWRCCWPPTTARRWSSRSGCRRPWPSSSTAAAPAATPRRSSPGCRSAAPLVDGRVIAALYRSRVSTGAILLLIVAGAGRGGRGAAGVRPRATRCWPGSRRRGTARRERSRAGSGDLSALPRRSRIAAVFLALAVGLVLGAGGVSDRLLGAVATKADGLDRPGPAAHRPARRAGRRPARRRRVRRAASAPAAVRGVLQGQTRRARHRRAPTGRTRDALVELIEQAGATVTGTVALTPAVTDPARADQLRELTAQLLPAGRAAARRGRHRQPASAACSAASSPAERPGARHRTAGGSACSPASARPGFVAAGTGARTRGPRARAHRRRAHRGRRGRRRGRRRADGRPARPRGPRRRAGGLRGLGRRHRRGRRRAGRPHRHRCAVHRRRRARPARARSRPCWRCASRSTGARAATARRLRRPTAPHPRA